MATLNATDVVGVFERPETAAHVVKELLRSGFRKQDITVLCSDETKEAYFHEFEHEMPAGSHNRAALNTAGVAGLVVGGAILLTILLKSSGLAIVLVAFAGIAAAGTFVALMMTRGSEKELADFYDQGVVRGQILVALERTGDSAARKRAEDIFREAGAKPAPLPKED
jgi:hypothetical protein